MNDAPLSRRRFLALGGAALGSLLMPRWARAAAAQAAGKDVLVVLFLRGGADGLNLIVPYGDPHYRRARPNIRVPEPGRPGGALDLDGRFGLHPGLAPLLPLWKEGRMAVVHAAGSPDLTRSHFDAQDYMENGVPGRRSVPDGWLNRALSRGDASRDALSAIAFAPRKPRMLRGPFPALSAPDLDALGISDPAIDTVEDLYGDALDDFLRGAASDLASARRAAPLLPPAHPSEFLAAGYPTTRLGRALFDAARVILAGIGTRVFCAEMDGWDLHAWEAGPHDALARIVPRLADSIAAFYRQLGARADRVTLVTLTEFGRALAENGALGTDHGHGSVMTLFGPVKGGVHGAWPGLAPEALSQGRDLAVANDFRRVLAELVTRRLGVRDIEPVFPGGPWAPLGLL
jgi:uncharacterized protein (DUF1501 family)